MAIGCMYGTCAGARSSNTLDLGKENQMVLEMRPAHDPTKTYGFVSVVVSLNDLSASIWLWHRPNGEWAIKKVIEIPAEPADPDLLPPALKDFKAVPPLVSRCRSMTVFSMSLAGARGRCSSTDVSDPLQPKLVGSVHIGGIVRRAAHPKDPERRLPAGPQMVEVCRDGRRVYFTNSLYAAWDEQFYPEDVGNWMVKLDVDPTGDSVRSKFFFETGEHRLHQIRLEGGDASSDSYCFALGGLLEMTGGGVARRRGRRGGWQGAGEAHLRSGLRRTSDAASYPFSASRRDGLRVRFQRWPALLALAEIAGSELVGTAVSRLGQGAKIDSNAAHPNISTVS